VPYKQPVGKECAPDRLPEEDGAALAGLGHKLEEAAAVVNWLGHDFGNVLTGVLGFAELTLEQVPPGSDAHTFTQEIARAAESGAEFVRKLLRFSRRTRTQSGATVLSTLLAQEAAHWQQLLGAEHALRLEVPADTPPVDLDVETLRSLLEPLLVNARQALAGPGNVTVTVRSATLQAEECSLLLGRASPGTFVEVDVADTGSGFQREARQRWLAEPFFSTRPRHHGLGLPIVYGILRTYGGGFCIQDVLPTGTRVRVFLPVAHGSSSQG